MLKNFRMFQKEKNRNDRRKLFILASSQGIGGAEARTMKFAAYAAENFDLDVNLVINQTLFNSVKANKFLKNLISHPKLSTTVYTPLFSRILSEDTRNMILKDRRLKRFLGYIPKFVIRELTWFRFLNKTVTDRDIIHCIFGDTARMGTYLFSRAKNGEKTPSIVEITSNRHVETWGCHLNYCFNKKVLPRKLFVKCVSETVYHNLIPNTRPHIEQIISPHKGPFIIIPKDDEVIKENIVLFAHRFIQPKNPLLFARAINELHQENKLEGWKVYIRGNGSLEQKIRQELKDLLLADIVKIGYTTNLIDEAKRAKIFVSIIETGNYPSQSLFESMRYGNILVLSNRGVTREKIGNNEAIHYVEDLSVSEIKNSLFKAIMQADSSGFEQLSKSIEGRYEEIASNSGYLETVKGIYQNGQ